MSTPFVKIGVDDSRLQAWVRHIGADALRKAIRNSVDRSGRESFKQAATLIEQETGVTKSKWGNAIGRMRRPTQFDLSARTTYSRKKVSILNVAGVKVVPSGGRGGPGISGSGWLLSSGGAIKFGHAFVVGARSGKGANKGKLTGGQYVLRRVGKGRFPVRAVVAATPAAVMGNDRSVPVKHFKIIATAALQRNLEADVQKVINGQGA